MGLIVQSAAGKVLLAEEFRPYLNTLSVRLYVNPISLDQDTMPAFVDDEPTDGGYSAETLPYPNPFVIDGLRARSSGVTFTWIFTLDDGPFTVYGVFFTDPDDPTITVFAAAADDPFPITAPGQIFQAEMAFTHDDEEADS